MSKDEEAMYELALQMPWVEALKFIREETGDSIKMAMYRLDSLADTHPDSKLALTLKERQNNS